jgi:hypothetical protein
MRVIVTDSAEQFFEEALSEALCDERVEASIHARRYLRSVLCREITEGRHPDETLGDRYLLAHRVGPVERTAILREVGDSAMVLSGLWWERAAARRGWPEIRYNITVGSRSYREVGGVPFDEMSAKFEGLVNALVRFGTAHSLATARDVLRLYQLWHQTHSRQAAEALARQGIIPVAGSVVPS